ncbi:MAG: anaerobic ribonucleoside-triphosphate reductase activating protein [Firmicutes bacterium]|nr:anaerobic ribonucleoside-triphosphate reductase activating protein [Bacillota bacterium]
MIISGFQKLTLVDYPEHMACLVFTQGCNFRCPFCHNKELIEGFDSKNEISEDEIFQYLDKRKGLIDGVCITGGEPLLQKDIALFMKCVKDKGYKIKLDTNGSKPEVLKKIIDAGLVDYVAMDIKNSFDGYGITSGIDNLDISNIKKSIEVLKNSNIDYEFRTTIVKELHNFDKIHEIISYLGSDVKYYLQNYRDCETVLVRGFHGFERKELLDIKNQLNKDYPNVKVRGI